MSARWDVAISEYAADLRSRGYYSAAVIENLVKRIRRYARECGHPSPYHATPDRISHWLDTLEGNLSVRLVYDYRIGLRTFYRWATEAGRMTTDPTTDLWGRQQELAAGPAWMQEIPAYLNALRAAAMTPATIRLRRHHIIRLGRTVGVHDPWVVTADDLLEWFGTLGCGRSALKTYQSSVRSFYRWAVDAGRITHDPSLKLPHIKQPPPAPRPATEDQVAQALSSADDRVQLMIRLCAELGLRISEVSRVHTRDLQADDSGWWLYILGKGLKPRRLPVTDSLACHIRARPTGYLFPGKTDGHLSPAHVGVLISPHLPPGVTPHKLRHRFATRTYMVERDVFAIQELLGHASPSTTQAYVKVPADSLRRLVDAVQIG